GNSKEGFKIESKLKSKDQLEKVKTLLAEKQTFWNEQLKILPNQKEIEILKKKFEQIKTKDFKDVNELQASVKALDDLSKEAQSKFSQLQTTSQQLQTDLNLLNQESNKINELIKEDTKTLESLLKIPSIDPTSITKSIFLKYLISKLSKYQKYMDMAQKYLPQSVTSGVKEKALNLAQGKKSKPEVDTTENSQKNTIVAHPRDKGINYEFSTPRSYPLFWIKDISISSKSSGNDGLGNIQGSIKNIVSNQQTIKKPTTMNIAGDFPSENLMGLSFDAKYDNLNSNNLIEVKSQIKSYPLENIQLLDSQDAKISFANTSAAFVFNFGLENFKKLSINNSNHFNEVIYSIDSQNSSYKPILVSLFEPIKKVTLNTQISGDLPQMNLSLNSNLGEEIQKNIQVQIQNQINKAKAAIEEYIQNEVGKTKKQLEAEINTLKTSLEGQISKTKTDLEEQKKNAEGKIEVAKNDSENKAKKEIENKVKDAAEELKKKFGF
ncbi:MAG TPA: TIGR03545 family protein, partial [Pseudobdellovibrionaceae bacterium]|nr:TIGR03545 family protein [Pseudobdellovibrionaceae bacterium]